VTRVRPVIAIDGPAGAGKSTVARAVARELGYLLVDTGALYRGVALAARERNVDWQDGPALGALARALDLALVAGSDGSVRLCIEGRDRSGEIRTPDISMGASHVSRHAAVREALRGIQRRLGEHGGAVLEGRDIGTVIFPDAEAKVFLTASPETRARRRVDELRARGEAVDFETTLREVQERDRQDQEREIAPLRPAPDSILVDTSGREAEEVVAEVLRIARSLGADDPPRRD
jgi:cytidylate kinase